MNMPSEPTVAVFDFRSGPLRGTQLTLHGARLLHHGVGYMESMPLAAIAAVRVGYERHESRIGWGVALGVAALLLFLVFRPLAAFAVGASAEVADGQAVGQLLRAALVVLGWIGTTTRVLMLPAAERVFPVRGQSPLLVEFAELLAERVAQRSGR